jgi:hypothetical protein
MVAAKTGKTFTGEAEGLNDEAVLKQIAVRERGQQAGQDLLQDVQVSGFGFQQMDARMILGLDTYVPNKGFDHEISSFA